MSAVISLADQIKCARRELAMRKSAYPKWVANKRMTQIAANHEITAMQEIVATLEALLSEQATQL